MDEKRSRFWSESQDRARHGSGEAPREWRGRTLTITTHNNTLRLRWGVIPLFIQSHKPSPGKRKKERMTWEINFFRCEDNLTLVSCSIAIIVFSIIVVSVSIVRFSAFSSSGCSCIAYWDAAFFDVVVNPMLSLQRQYSYSVNICYSSHQCRYSCACFMLMYDHRSIIEYGMCQERNVWLINMSSLVYVCSVVCRFRPSLDDIFCTVSLLVSRA